MASSYTLDVGHLTGPARRTLAVDTLVDVPDFEDLRFPKAARVVLELRGMDRGIQVTGTIEANVAAECRRCLEDVEIPLLVEVDERLEASVDEGDPLAESNVLAGETLDLGDLVRQLATTALPLGVQCSEDCRGLCPRCGRNRNDAGCTCASMEGDHGES